MEKQQASHSVHTYKFVCTMHYGLSWSEINLRFYVKLILADFRRSKNANVTILNALNFYFWENYKFQKIKNQKLKDVRMIKMVDFDTLNNPFYMNSILRAIILILENFTPEN